MRADKDSVVSFHYAVRDAADHAAEPFDDSRKRGEPMRVLLGHGQLVAGVEKALAGHAAGDRFEIGWFANSSPVTTASTCRWAR